MWAACKPIAVCVCVASDGLLSTRLCAHAPQVVSRHSNREYKLADIDDKPANVATFFDEQAGRERTIVDYFQEKYPQHRIDFPHVSRPAAPTLDRHVYDTS